MPAMLRPPELPLPLRVATPAVATAAAAGLQLALLPEPEIAPYALFFFAVALAAWLAGRAAGAATVALSALAADWFFVPPYRSFELVEGAGAATAVFVASALAIALLAGSLRLALREAEAAAERLRDADRRKDEFLAVLSHELRNPLAPISNALRVLEQAPPESGLARDARAVMGRQLAHLARLVDQILDVTRITRGKVVLRRAPMDLGAAARDTVEDHRELFASRGLRVSLDARPGAWIDADRTRVVQVIGNLLQNAAKFTPEGGRVRVSVAPDDARREAVLQVVDDGVGIPDAVLRRLFVPFSQADETLDRARGGLGIGLALVKGLVELHGGTATAESAGPGRGATFTVRLPLVPAPEVAEPAPAAPGKPAGPAPAPLRVLVVDDNVDAADTLRDLLALDGHEVESLHDGREALAAARRFRPDAIVCDIGLPGMSGYEVAAAIRRDPELAAVTLVALTGYAAAADVARARAAGFDGHVAKPPDVAKLEALLRRPRA